MENDNLQENLIHPIDEKENSIGIIINPTTAENKESKQKSVFSYKNHLHLTYIIFWAFVISIGGFQFGYLLTVFNTANDYMSYILGWKNHSKSYESNMIAITSSAIPVGAFFGSLSIFYVVRNGRLKMFYLIYGLLIIGVALTTIFQNSICFVIGRFIEGACVGYFSGLVPIYLREISPTKIKGFLNGLNIVMVNLGELVSFAMGFGLPENNQLSYFWRLMFGFPMLIMIIHAILTFSCFNSDTPKSYLLHDSESKALQSLKKIYKYQNDQQNELQQIQNSIMMQSSKQISWKELCGPDYKKALIVCCLIHIFQQFSGTTAIMFYSTSEIFSEGGESGHTSVFYTTMMGVINLVGHILAALIVDLIGRKIMSIYGSLVMAITNLTLGFGAYFGWTLVKKISVFVFSMAYSLSLGPLAWIYMAEVLPEKGVSIGCSINWACSSFVSYLSKILMSETPLDVYGTFWCFSGIMIISTIFSMIMVNETKGKNEVQIRKLYYPKFYKK